MTLQIGRLALKHRRIRWVESVVGEMPVAVFGADRLPLDISRTAVVVIHHPFRYPGRRHSEAGRQVGRETFMLRSADATETEAQFTLRGLGDRPRGVEIPPACWPRARK